MITALGDLRAKSPSHHNNLTSSPIHLLRPVTLRSDLDAIFGFPVYILTDYLPLENDDPSTLPFPLLLSLLLLLQPPLSYLKLIPPPTWVESVRTFPILSPQVALRTPLWPILLYTPTILPIVLLAPPLLPHLFTCHSTPLHPTPPYSLPHPTPLSSLPHPSPYLVPPPSPYSLTPSPYSTSPLFYPLISTTPPPSPSFTRAIPTTAVIRLAYLLIGFD